MHSPMNISLHTKEWLDVVEHQRSHWRTVSHPHSELFIRDAEEERKKGECVNTIPWLHDALYI